MTILEELTGISWSLVQYQSQSKDGEIIYPLGEDAVGTIIFTNEEHMAVQIMAADRTQKRSVEELEQFNTEVEKEMAEIGYHAYTGPFSVDEDESILTTHVKFSLLADYVGSDQSRQVLIEEDLLHLSNIKHPERKLIWKRIV